MNRRIEAALRCGSLFVTSEKSASTPGARPHLRVLVVDDHPLMRRGVVTLLSGEPDLELFAEVGSAEAALRALSEGTPDVAIVDLAMPGAGGLDLVKSLVARLPGLPVIVFSMHDEGEYARRALSAGARGFVMKSVPPDLLLGAVRTVASGGVYLSEAMTSRLLQETSAGVEPGRGPELTDRELEVLERLGEGLTVAEIARALHLSAKTVETYRSNLRRKLSAPTNARLLQHAVIRRMESSGQT